MNNGTVAHNFVYGEAGRGSNFYSQDKDNYTKLISYSSLMAINFKKENLILVSKRISSYSNSSSKQFSHLRSAVNNQTVIYVEDISFRGGYSDSYADVSKYINQNHLKDSCDELVEIYKKQKRARKADYSYQINKLIENAKNIIEYGKIDKRSSEYKLFQKLIENTNLDKLIADSIEAEKIANKKKARKEFDYKKEQFEKFTGSKCPYKKPTDLSYNWIKIEDDKLKTNAWVTVTLKNALKLYKAFKKGLAIVGQKIDHYTIIKADEKIVQIGCHKILVKELDRVLGSAS